MTLEGGRVVDEILITKEGEVIASIVDSETTIEVICKNGYRIDFLPKEPMDDYEIIEGKRNKLAKTR